MKTPSGNNSVYNLLSDIFRIIGRYSQGEIGEALRHTDLTAKGEYHDIMLNILRQMQRLSENQELEGAVKETSEKSDAAQVSTPVSKKDPRIREIRAMLEDDEFMPSKQDVLKLIKTHFHEHVTPRTDKRDSKRDLITKVLKAFSKMSDSRKQTVYSTLRRSFLKNRKSHLDEWADIITNGEGSR